MAKPWGVKSRNAAQADAITHLLNPEIDLVVLSGLAGSGKTLLAIACGLEQVIEQHMYSDIVFTRAPVSVGDDLGFLPGTVDDKMLPWAGALVDNLEYLRLDPKDAERYINILAIQHMRGRSLRKRYVIIDETQNITQQQLKVLITRAGEDSKFVLLGDADQIDKKGLTKDNNALSYICDKAKTYEWARVVYLPDGERSRLATWGSTL